MTHMYDAVEHDLAAAPDAPPIATVKALVRRRRRRRMGATFTFAVVVLITTVVVAASLGRQTSEPAVSVSPTTATAPTTTTSVAVSDDATIWCNDENQNPRNGALLHITAIQQAAATIHVVPLLTVDEKKFLNPNGTKNLTAFQDAWEAANDDPANLPHYPTSLADFAGRPWHWWTATDWARICNAAFKAR